LRLVRPLLLGDRANGRSRAAQFLRFIAGFVLATIVTQLQVLATAMFVSGIGIGLYLVLDSGARAQFDLNTFFTSKDISILLVRGLINIAIIITSVLLDRPFLDSFNEIPDWLPTLRFLLRLRLGLTRAIIRVGSTMILMGLSLLPLSALLLALPATNPSEAVLTDVVEPTRSKLRRLGRRAIAILTASALLIALLAFATEIVTRLHFSGDTFYGTIIHRLLPDSLLNRLPFSLVEHWPYVLFAVYILDLGMLLVIAKVPLSYSYRNLIVRWHITALTAVAFFVVVFMLTFMLAFVNGMTKLTEQSGIPGNVLVMSDGATDELFSNLGYGDVGNIERIIATEDEHDNPLRKPVTVKTMKVGGKTAFMGSRETYCVVNQIVPNSNNRRRFVQLRIIVDGEVSSAVHNLELLDRKQSWFTTVGVDDQSRVQCVLGQGVAATLGGDQGKKSLEPGDTFELADLEWVVVGVMKTEGTTFGSEVWCSNINKVTTALGKKSYTSYVLRVNDESEDSARAMAYHIRNRYQTQKLKAVPEKEYFADLNKNNQQTLYSVIVVAIVMAIGGIFGIMNTMYSAIAQRTRDIGVLRLLGFKRWQVLVAFLLESMTIALFGGLIGVGLGYICNGFEVTSIASAGQGGGKSVVAKLVVDHDVVLIGILFTLIMGRLGGLVPALSAMRLKILESLR
jgi:ABC-type lipoprotein release transport system permease subunit